MKLIDLITTSIRNLRRRKLRTLLTVLGVVIGTASVVTMLSIGFGMTRMTEDMYASYGSMSLINVSAPYSYNGSSDQQTYITDEVIETFSKLPDVDYVSPKLSTQAIIRQGKYSADISLVGVSTRFLNELDFVSGEAPEPGEQGLVMGNMIRIFFSDEKGMSTYWETGVPPDVDYTKPLYVIFDVSTYYNAMYSKEPGTKYPKKYMMNVAAELAGGLESYSDDAYSVYMDIDALKAKLKQIYKKDPIPGQPTNSKGKPYNYFIYDSAAVYCRSSDAVEGVQKTIQGMGYNCYSNMEWLNQSKDQLRITEAALGGIGAVALLVAAIGIANTMMMSIYERTKEIGIMKVLGCDMNEIRDMFLIESGFIGLIGGAMGVGLSYLISYLVNNMGLGELVVGLSGKLSLIPAWLAAVAVVFAILISMLAGLAPAVKAMKLSPLEAIRNE